MYKAEYSDVVADDPRAARSYERMAFDHVIGRLEAAQSAGPGSPQTTQALDDVDTLWTVLMRDLADVQNPLPDGLKAQLISIGLWIYREIAALRMQAAGDLNGLIAVNSAIRAGLG